MAKLLGSPLDGGETKYEDEIIGLHYSEDQPTRVARYDRQPNGDYRFVKTYNQSELEEEK